MRSEQDVRDVLSYYEHLIQAAQAESARQSQTDLGQDSQEHQQISQDIVGIDYAIGILRWVLGDSQAVVPKRLHEQYGSGVNMP